MNAPTILVVMPLYNAAEYVEKAVESIFSQTYTGYQLLVVDDGSSDGSNEIVSKYVGSKLILSQQKNGGPGVAMNRAIQYAYENQIPFIARMDADDLSLPMRLDIELQLLNKKPHAVACSCNCYYIDSSTEKIVSTSTVSSRSPIIKWEIKHGLRGLIQGATLFRTDALVKIGGYRPQFRAAEEADLFLRLAEKFDLVNAREYLYKIRMNQNSLSLQNSAKNVLYHFYALECWRKRNARKPEDDFDTFLRKIDWRLSLRIWREEFLLKLWRANIARHSLFLVILASLVDPRRAIARVLRNL